MAFDAEDFRPCDLILFADPDSFEPRRGLVESVDDGEPDENGDLLRFPSLDVIVGDFVARSRPGDDLTVPISRVMARVTLRTARVGCGDLDWTLNCEHLAQLGEFLQAYRRTDCDSFDWLRKPWHCEKEAWVAGIEIDHVEQRAYSKPQAIL